MVQELIPFITQHYHCSTDPQLMAFGGSSLGGVCALAMAMRHPQVFGSVLVESPSMWIGEERFLEVSRRRTRVFLPGVYRMCLELWWLLHVVVCPPQIRGCMLLDQDGVT